MDVCDTLKRLVQKFLRVYRWGDAKRRRHFLDSGERRSLPSATFGNEGFSGIRGALAQALSEVI